MASPVPVRTMARAARAENTGVQARIAGLLVFLVLFTTICAVIQIVSGAYSHGRSLAGDEASHMVNSLLVFEWLRTAPFSNPLHFATSYYEHYPRVTIGHWPPLFYAIQAAVFFVAGASSAVALGFQALLTGLACAWPAALVQRRAGWLAGAATGLFVLASPDLLFLLNAVMVDTALGVLILATALCWARFAERRSAGWAIGFAVAASAAILTKGNGVALATLPLLHAAITRDLRPLRNWRAWMAAALVAAATMPWYVLTYRIAADGFNYPWGWAYTSRAVPAYAAGALQTLGAVGLVGFGAGLWRLLRQRPEVQDQSVAALAAASVAVFLFQIVAPADITARYLVALVPATSVVIGTGLAALLRRVRPRPVVVGLGTALVLLVGAALIVRPPHVSPFGMRPLARDVLASSNPNTLVLVVGETRAEGALIAAFAELDHGERHYVLRGTQMLASGGFMGQGYATRFADAAAVERWLKGSGIGWLVLQTGPGAAVMAHDGQVQQAVARLGLHPVATEDVRGAGAVLLYRLSETPPTPAQMAALLARVVPSTRVAAVPSTSLKEDQKNASNQSSTAPGASSAK